MKSNHSSLFLERMRKNRLAHSIGMAMAALFSLKVAEVEAEDAVVSVDAEDLKQPSSAGLDIGPQPEPLASPRLLGAPPPMVLDNPDTVGVRATGNSVSVSEMNIQANATDTIGVLAEQGGTVDIKDSTLFAKAEFVWPFGQPSVAIKATGAGSVVNGDNLDISTPDTGAIAVMADDGATVKLRNSYLSDGTIVSASGVGSNLELINSDADFVMGNDQSAVTVTDSTLRGGLQLSDGGGSADISGSSLGGLFGHNESFGPEPAPLQTFKVDNSQIGGESTDRGVQLGGNIEFEMKNSTVHANDMGMWLSTGMSMDSKNTASVTIENSQIQVGSEKGGLFGIEVDNSSPSAQAQVVLKDTSVKVHSGDSDGTYYQGDRSGLGVWGSGQTDFQLDGSHIAVSTDNPEETAIGVNLHNAAATVTLRNDSSVVGQDVGIRASNQYFPELPADNTVTVDNSLVKSEQGTAVEVQDFAQLTVDVKNNGRVESGNGVLADVINQGKLTLNVDGSQLSGDIRSDRAEGEITHWVQEGDDWVEESLFTTSSSANVNLQNSAQWTGTGSNIDAMRIDPTSQWTMTGNSNVGQLDTQGTVAFQPGNGYKTLTVEGDLDGSGTFAMNTDIAERQGDQLVVQGTARGTHQLAIEDSGKQPAHLDALKVVDTNGGPASFDLKGGHVDAGAYRYNLTQSADDWYLAYHDLVPTDPVVPTEPGEPSDPTRPVDPVDPLDPTEPGEPADPTGPDDRVAPIPPVTPALPEPRPQDLSKGANAALGMQSATSLLFNAEMDSLNQRLGDIRGEKGEGGVWVRGLGKRFEVDSGKSREFDQDIQGVQVGADKAIPLASGKLHVGGMVGASKADMDFGEGAKGEVDATSVGAYGTYLREDGWYVDGVAKLQNFDADVKMPNNLGRSVKGDYSGKGVGISVEAGKHIKLENDWFVEPQAQLSASRVDGPDYTSSDGMKVDGEAMDSLQGRIGARFGKFIPLDQGRSLQPFVKINQIHEFKGNADVKVNDVVKLDNALPGSRTEIGVGAQLNLGEKHKVYVEAEAAKGDEVEQPVGINIGYRYDW
ncbi:autotransporter outer membrane beta-barrel domain-containing protein [Pseudomonas nitroreducens]|uniref:autotransporter outer membrane beta-barrel domain-containing protein n=1 Tax=Pseudomonas nitroreducens TaxID=46680 RepID=UPI00351D178D